MHRTPWTRALTTIAAAALLAGCSPSGTSPNAETGTSSSGGEQLGVTVPYYALQYLVQRLGQDAVKVDSLTPAGGEPHDVELSPSQIAGLSGTSIFFYLKGFQPAVDEAAANASGPQVVDVSEAAQLESSEHHEEEAPAGTQPTTPETSSEHTPDEHGADAHSHDDGDHHDGEHHDGEHGDEHQDPESHASGGDAEAPTASSSPEHDHDHGGVDPHYWLDPQRQEQVARQVADTLKAALPENADAIESAFGELSRELQGLTTTYGEALGSCQQRTMVVTHEAFHYLAERFDFHQEGILGVDPDTEPSPARLLELKQQIQELGVSTIYSEPLLRPDVAQTLVEETGAQVRPLNPLESVPDGEDYLSVMKENLIQLQAGQECAAG